MSFFDKSTKTHSRFTYTSEVYQLNFGFYLPQAISKERCKKEGKRIRHQKKGRDSTYANPRHEALI